MIETIAVLIIETGALLLAARSVYKSLSAKEGCSGNCGSCKSIKKNKYYLTERTSE